MGPKVFFNICFPGGEIFFFGSIDHRHREKVLFRNRKTTEQRIHHRPFRELPFSTCLGKTAYFSYRKKT